MNLKTVVASLLVCLFAIANVNASEVETSEIVESEYVSIESEQVSEQVSEIVESEVSSEISVSENVKVETRGSGYIPEYTIESVFKGEKLVTYYKDYVKYKAELFYTSGEKHADYYYNTNGDWVKYVEYHKSGLKKDYRVRNNQKVLIEDYAYYGNGKVSEFIKRYDNGKMKERAWYFSSGQLRKVHNYYSNGRIDKVRYWNEQGIKTDHREYYNQKNTQLKADYAYHSNGKVSEFIKRYDNGKMKERAWYFYSGQLRKVHNYYSTGRIYMVRYWNEKGIKTDHREYYNQSNTQFKADYAYYDNGKVSEFIKWKSNGKRIEHVWIWKNGDSKNYKRIKRYNSKGQVYSDKSYKDRTVVSKPPVVTPPSKPPVTNPPTSPWDDTILAVGVEGCKKIMNEDYAARNWIVDLTGEPNGRPSIWGDNAPITSSCHIQDIPNGKNKGRGRAYVVDNGDGTYDIGWQQTYY